MIDDGAEYITLRYNRQSGILTDAKGAVVTTSFGLDSFKLSSLKVKDVVKLKDAGFDHAAIIEIFRASGQWPQQEQGAQGSLL